MTISTRQAANLLLDLLAGFNEGRDPGRIIHAADGTAIVHALIEGSPYELRLRRRTPLTRQTHRRATVALRPVILKLYKEKGT
jgi:hypothetical protein